MRLFRSKLAKRILGIVLVMGCSSIFFNGYVGVNEAHAQVTNNQGVSGPRVVADNQAAQNNNTNQNNQTNITTMGLFELLNLILKIIYLLLRPLIVIAGISLDNTLVYASIFHLDAPLRKFWNMMKNFANFTLGFMVLFAIIKSVLTGGGEGSLKDEKSPLGIIKKTLIAGVLIQASWFIMAALVDISTVATYAVGGLPLSVLKNTDIGNQKILSVNSQIDLNKFDVLNKDAESFKVRYSTNYNGKVIKMSPCLVKESFVIGREFGDPSFRNTDKFDNDPTYKGYEACVLFGNQIVMRKEDEFMEAISTNIEMDTTPDRTDAIGYKTMINALLNYTGRDTKGRVTGALVNLKDGTGGLATGSMFFDQTTSTTISQLINKSKGFVGPLVTIYSSLLNFAQLTDTNVTTIGETSGIFLIKSGVAIALFFPLIALAIVLIARIGLLRLYIAGSPFLVIKHVFDKFIPEKALGKLSKHLDIGNVIKLIFAPVIIVAALSISLIFMTALINGFKSGDNQHLSEKVAENLQIQPIPAIQTGNRAVQVAGSSELEFKNLDRGGTLDRFSWLVVNFFAIGLLRTILFAAIKANALGDFIQKNVQEFGSNVFKTMPILPFGEGGEKVGVGAARTELKNRPSTWMGERIQKQTTSVETFFKQPVNSNIPEFTPTQATNIATKLGTGTLKSTEVTTAITEAGLTAPTTLTDLGTAGNISAMYTAINDLYKNNENQRNLAAKNAEAMFGTGWFDTEAKRVATEKFTTDIGDKITKDKHSSSDIQQLLDANKDTATAYFKVNTSFEKTLDDDKKTKITITPKSDGSGYDIKSETTK